MKPNQKEETKSSSKFEKNWATFNFFTFIQFNTNPIIHQKIVSLESLKAKYIFSIFYM